MEQQEQRFESWCIVELFGHQRIAGRVTEAQVGGCSFIRVDVPETHAQPAFTRFFGQGAIYSITPVSEEVARAAGEYLRERPVSVYMLPSPQPLPDAPDECNVQPDEIEEPWEEEDPEEDGVPF
jgi:hypothetical protein